MNLTNNTKKLMKQLYKDYSKRCSNNDRNPKLFEAPLNVDEITDNLDELENAGFIITFNDYSFELQQSFIAYMENKFKNDIAGIIDVIAKFRP